MARKKIELTNVTEYTAPTTFKNIYKICNFLCSNTGLYYSLRYNNTH